MSNTEPPRPPSDFGGTPPPPPGFGDVPPPPPGFGATPPPPPGFGGTPPPPAYQQSVPPAPYAGHDGAPTKPPRPDVKLGAILAIVGSLISVVGVFLPWVSGGGDAQNGTGTFLGSDFTLYDSPGSAMIVLAVITGGLGIALFFAGRVLAVAIIAIVFATISILAGIGMIGIASDTADFADSSLGFGAILQPIAPLITLAGSIVATAKRRR